MKRGQIDFTEVGKLGEQLAFTYLKQISKDFKDVRALRDYQLRDIDAIVNSEFWEVKTDTRIGTTGNFCFELKRDNDGPGCFYRSKADKWLYVDLVNGLGYIFGLSDAQAWLACNTDKWRLDNRARVHRDHKWVSYTVALVPIDLFLSDIKSLTIKLAERIQDVG